MLPSLIQIKISSKVPKLLNVYNLRHSDTQTLLIPVNTHSIRLQNIFVGLTNGRNLWDYQTQPAYRAEATGSTPIWRRWLRAGEGGRGGGRMVFSVVLLPKNRDWRLGTKETSLSPTLAKIQHGNHQSKSITISLTRYSTVPVLTLQPSTLKRENIHSFFIKTLAQCRLSLLTCVFMLLEDLQSSVKWFCGAAQQSFELHATVGMATCWVSSGVLSVGRTELENWRCHFGLWRRFHTWKSETWFKSLLHCSHLIQLVLVSRCNLGSRRKRLLEDTRASCRLHLHGLSTYTWHWLVCKCASIKHVVN